MTISKETVMVESDYLEDAMHKQWCNILKIEPLNSTRLAGRS